ncbi:MAG: hypothetical protein JWQ49_4940 [Edaphobacter sp.]|nr:hypothetical protein [Edaphobacter sp.]
MSPVTIALDNQPRSTLRLWQNDLLYPSALASHRTSSATSDESEAAIETVTRLPLSFAKAIANITFRQDIGRVCRIIFDLFSKLVDKDA